MASRAGAAPDWRAAFRRSFRRATHMAGAGLLFVLLVFLTLALASYTQTDPSPSTAAPERSQEIQAAHDRLVQPQAMGELFKCMALSARDWPRGAGFPEGQRRTPPS